MIFIFCPLEYVLYVELLTGAIGKGTNSHVLRLPTRNPPESVFTLFTGIILYSMEGDLPAAAAQQLARRRRRCRRRTAESENAALIRWVYSLNLSLSHLSLFLSISLSLSHISLFLTSLSLSLSLPISFIVTCLIR